MITMSEEKVYDETTKRIVKIYKKLIDDRVDDGNDLGSSGLDKMVNQFFSIVFKRDH